jgi:DNA gyrase subunit A
MSTYKQGNDTIITQDTLTGYIDEMARYAIADNRRRMIPDIRDGLKPVQRRDIYGMSDIGANSEATKKKCARIVGDVMGKYHPHGDCIHPETAVYLIDGSITNIKTLYDQVVPRYILAVDQSTGNVVPAVAHDFRIGQYTDEIYHIILSNGNEVRCTGNHPFMLPDGKWIQAKDMHPYMRIYNNPLLCNSRPVIDTKLVQNLVNDYYMGDLPKDLSRHHIDENYFDNEPENFIRLTSEQHAMVHGDWEKGLVIGRARMFRDDSPIRDETRQKNTLLRKIYNESQAIRRFKRVISMMEDMNMDITEENYESFRDKVYNLPMVDRLIDRHPDLHCHCFEDLVNVQIPTVGEVYNDIKPEKEVKEKPVHPVKWMKEYLGLRFVSMYSVIDRMIDAGLPYGMESYYQVAQKHANETHVGLCLRTYALEKPYVTDIWVEKVHQMPMYDFTVDGYENMLIPVGTTMGTDCEILVGNTIPMICIHNSAIYGALRPIANWWECKIPLVRGWGNFGTFQGDGMAAMRYTEAYLSEFSVEFLQLLSKYESIVDWSPNFDNSRKEPDYLPFLIPVLLINGASGVGTGVRMDLPPHNPKEVIAVTRKLLRDPSTEVVLAPDFCMPCDIIDTDWKEISNTGCGKFRARGRAEIGEYKKHPAIFITSLPQGVNSNSISSKINEMVTKGVLDQVKDILWEGSEKEVRLVIQLKKDASPDYVLEMIYKFTQLESSYRVNFEAIHGVDHIRFSYKSYLEAFIETAKLTIFRMYCEKYQIVMTRWHTLDAYIKVITSGEIDNIYKSIRKSKSSDMEELIQWLCKKLDITDVQAGYIIHADLGKFSKGYLEKYKAEAAQCWQEKELYQSIILDDNKIIEELDKTLDYYDKKYCKPRICRVIKESDTSNVPKGIFKIVVTEKNFIKKIPENDNANVVKGDYPNLIIRVDNTENLLLFSSAGKVFKLPIYKIPLSTKSAVGTDIRTLIKGLTSDICNVIYEPDIIKASKIKRKHYLVVTSAGNSIKKLDLEDFLTVPPSGIIYTKLAPGDAVADASIVADGMDVVIYSGHKALRMGIKDIPHYKRNSVGVTAMNTSDKIEGINAIYDDVTHILVVTRSGRLNKIDVSGLNRGKRAQVGNNVIKLGKADSIVGIYGVNDYLQIRLATTNNTYTLDVKDIPISSSAASGMKLKEIKGSEVVVKAKILYR